MDRTEEELRAEAEATAAALTAGDFDALREMRLHPEFSYRSVVSTNVDDEVYVGVDGIARWWQANAEVWDGLRTELRGFELIGPDVAIATFRTRGVARSSGIPLDFTSHQVWRYRDGLLAEGVSFADRAEAERVAAEPSG